MEAQVVAALHPMPGGLIADGTVGGGGHAAAILKASAPTGHLVGCDRDGMAVEAATSRLSQFTGRFEIRRGNFADMAEWIAPESCDGVLLDLGVSSPQLDLPERGFSFQQDGPLDMRQDQRQELTAAKIVNEYGGDELAEIFWKFGGEEQSRRIARAIVRERETNPFKNTRQLAGLIEKIAPRARKKAHPATKVFQALRMAVNDEIGSLRRGLDAAMTILKPGSRLAVISFHSVEDRVVKEFGRRLSRDYEIDGDVDVPELRRPRAPLLRLVTRKALAPDAEELRENPRSRSAQCRVMEKL
ncbi:MAG TPA: 16S rRNA (cytosine(1402)-N(4))-methyltransferase RsmH [Verrucomicrobiae bacterium]|jgi:16S rRNA (cytosine1402-N4)-methyltransferase|nr:16S rRNA (cytosine(1402)-N(4))-methyltransferase RsmH [Verrucomicrobiae bacterium]